MILMYEVYLDFAFGAQDANSYSLTCEGSRDNCTTKWRLLLLEVLNG